MSSDTRRDLKVAEDTAARERATAISKRPRPWAPGDMGRIVRGELVTIDEFLLCRRG